MSGSSETPRSETRRWRPSVIIAALAVSFALLTFLRTAPSAPKAKGPEHADAAVVSELTGVATVSDGDSIRLGPRRIRLDGIMAPERRVLCGDVNVYRAATDALRNVMGSRQVQCRISDQPDADGRDLAQCTVGEIDLNAYMVVNGWARDWPLHSGGAYADEEATARAARLGVWSASCPADLWGDRDF